MNTEAEENAERQHFACLVSFVVKNPFSSVSICDLIHCLEAGLNMCRKTAIAITVCLAILMVAGVLWFVFQPEKPVPRRQAQRVSEVVGVGIALMSVPQTREIVVVTVHSNTPASEAGITNGVILVKVDDLSLAAVPLADVANRVRGPVGSKVRLELVTPDRTQTNTVELTRRKLQL
jgi:S1-C subfamily serine protease